MPKVTEQYFNDKKKEILEATYRVCYRKPIMNVEIKDIIEECGYSHGAIYRYYKDIDEILRDLIISINRSYSLRNETDEIFAKKLSAEQTINEICELLSNQMKSLSQNVLKISIYCHILAINEPQRADKIAGTINEQDKSPLVYLVTKLSEFLHSAKDKAEINPTKSVEEILDFLICSYEGIMIGATFCDEQKFNSYPQQMFSLLSDSLTSLICK